VNFIFWNGIIGKSFKGVRNMIPKWVRWLSGAVFDGAVAYAVTGWSLYIASAYLGSAAIWSIVAPAALIAFAGYGVYSTVNRFNKWRASKKGGDTASKGGH
jgi:hypothetical protein